MMQTMVGLAVFLSSKNLFMISACDVLRQIT